jgi:hypothetical protein
MVRQALMSREPAAVRGYLRSLATKGLDPQTVYQEAVAMLAPEQQKLAPRYDDVAPSGSTNQPTQTPTPGLDT